jgi:hypothetical protein
MAARLRARLHRLERTAQGALPSGQDGEPGEPRTKAEWIDRTGELLWQHFWLDKVFARGAEPAGGPDYVLAFRRAAEAAWAEGHRRRYPRDRLREAAAAAWAAAGPRLFRSEPRWVWDEPAEPMPPAEELHRLPDDELVRIYMRAIHRRGHWEGP